MMLKFSQMLLFLLAVGLLAHPTHADETTAKDWLDLSMQRVAASYNADLIDSDEGILYDLPEITYRLAIYYAKLGEKELGQDALKVLKSSSELLIESEGEGLLWPRTYLPGPAAALGVDVEVTMPTDATNQVFTQQILAEAYLAMGDPAKYQQACDAAFALLDAAQANDIKEAKEYEYAYYGNFYSWHFMRIFRDYEDLTNARKFASYAWKDDCERGGVLAMLAQMEWVAGNKDAARALVQQAATLVKQSVQRYHQELAELDPEIPEDEVWGLIYYPDLDSYLPELYAAMHLATDAEQAQALAQAMVLPDTSWKVSGYVHTASMLRRTGDKEQAQAMIAKAYTALEDEANGPWSYDIMHLGREVALQGQDDLLKSFEEDFDSKLVQAFFALGVAEAKMRQ